MADENDDAPENAEAIEQAEQALEQLQELLAAAQASLDTLESASQEEPDGEWLEEAESGMEALAGALEQLAQAREAWSEKLALVAETIVTEIGELQGAMAECAEHTGTANSAATTALESLGEHVDEGVATVERTNEDLVQTAGAALDDSLATVQQRLEELGASGEALRLDDIASASAQAIRDVCSTVAELESAGVGVAGDVIGTVDDITGQIDGIVTVIGTIKPVFDAVAVIA